MSLVTGKVEGALGAPDGVHSGLDPLFVPATRFHSAVNITFRNGLAETRPDFNRESQDLPAGKFQGAAPHIQGDQAYLVFAVDGWLYQYRLRDRKVIATKHQVPRMSHRVDRFTFTHAGQHLVVNDGLNPPVFITGERARRADGAKLNPLTELPGEWGPSTYGTYLYGRLSFVLPGTDAFLVGDPQVPGRYPDNHLFTSENTYLQGAGSFQSASPAPGPLTALAAWPVLDAPTGIGGLLAFKRGSVESYDLTVDRRAWGTVNISRVILARGTESANSVVVVNNDVFFRNRDGVYSLRTGRGESDTGLTLSYSRANEAYIRHDSPELLRVCSSAVFDNRLLMTCAPRRMILPDGRFDFWHAGVAAWDHDADNTIRTGRENAEGVWTGLPITQMVTVDVPNARARCFAFTKTASGGNELWELSDQSTGRDNYSKLVESKLHTRAMAFTGPANKKRMGHVEVWLAGLRGPGSVRYAIRTDRKEAWKTSSRKQDWTFVDNACAIADTRCYPAAAGDGCSIPCYQTGQLTRLASDDFKVDFYEVEVRLSFTGRFRLNAFRLDSTDAVDAAGSESALPKKPETVTGQPEDLFDYQVAHV